MHYTKWCVVLGTTIPTGRKTSFKPVREIAQSHSQTLKAIINTPRTMFTHKYLRVRVDCGYIDSVYVMACNSYETLHDSFYGSEVMKEITEEEYHRIKKHYKKEYVYVH